MRNLNSLTFKSLSKTGGTMKGHVWPPSYAYINSKGSLSGIQRMKGVCSQSMLQKRGEKEDASTRLLWPKPSAFYYGNRSQQKFHQTTAGKQYKLRKARELSNRSNVVLEFLGCFSK